MKDSERHQTTSSGLKGNRSRYDLETPPPAEHISYRPDMVGRQYGWVKIISPEKRWNKAMNRCYVLTRCQGCGSIQWQNLANLKSGKSKGCQQCSQPRQVPLWLYKRLSAAKQRCENPKSPQYPQYGARGIRFLFRSVTEAGLYLMRLYGTPQRELEVDRINTNGNYEPGNLRFVTKQENQANRRNTILSEFQQEYWPYTESVVKRKLAAGMSRTEIIHAAQQAVQEKRKCWRIISARLDFMTYEMPEDIIVLPYRGNLSTTVDTADQREL